MSKTELFVRKQSGGMFSVINENVTTGSIFWVDSGTGTDAVGYGRNPDAPLATIDYAIGQCTASKGDIIYVMPFHAENKTVTPITVDVKGISIIGLGHGVSRPVITNGTAMDTMTITANNVTIKNLEFAAPGIDAVTADINIDGDYAAVQDCVFHGSTAALNKVAFITLTATAADVLIDHCQFHNLTVEMPGGIVFEGACDRVEVKNCYFTDAIGFTGGCINDGATATNLYIHDNIFANAKANTVVAEFGNNSTGVCAYNCINGRNTTIAANWTLSTGMAYFENYVVEEVSKSGLLLPAVDAE